ncbi:MAG TPA: hypothetical protein VGL80_22520 [Pseudonocardiaceae bacterium]|jgi:hypothetical protein
MYHMVNGEHLSTIFDDGPTVTFVSNDGHRALVMEFDSSAIDDTEENWLTSISFSRVLDFHFYDSEIGLPLPNESDYEFALIEVENSEVIDLFKSSRSLERTAMPVTRLGDLHHYRVSFDDHGTYDVVCVGLTVAYRRIAN